MKYKLLKLNSCNLTKLTKEDLKAFCDLNEFKYDELDMLDLEENELTNIDFITENTSFINLKYLNLYNNKMKDITNLKYLTNLEHLIIKNLKLKNEKETIEILKTMSKLNYLNPEYAFKKYTFQQLKEELPNVKIER